MSTWLAAVARVAAQDYNRHTSQGQEYRTQPFKRRVPEQLLAAAAHNSKKLHALRAAKRAEAERLAAARAGDGGAGGRTDASRRRR